MWLLLLVLLLLQHVEDAAIVVLSPHLAFVLCMLFLLRRLRLIGGVHFDLFGFLVGSRRRRRRR